MSTELIQRTVVSEICAYRDAALAKAREAAALLEQGHALADEARELATKASAGRGFYLRDRSQESAYSRLFSHFNRAETEDVYRKHLDACIWMHLMDRAGVSDLMDKTAKDAFYEDLCGNVFEVTEDNVYTTLAGLRDQAQEIFQRGLARAFADLDRRFKSHDGFKIGGRIVLTNVFDGWGSWNYHSRMADTLQDIERVFAVLAGEHPDPGELRRLIDADRPGWGSRQSVTESRYFRVRVFKNGNAHLWFTRDDLVEKANKQLADYYGEVLPDAVPEDAPEDLRSKGGALCKNLSFYASPPPVVKELLRNLWITDAHRVLEPSAGTGHIARAVLEHGAQVDAIEVHPDRVAALRGIGHPRLNVIEANFLRVGQRPEYDFVVMNPPFYGTHWMEHVIHAFGFLKPGGTLVSVLPVTADLGETKKHRDFRAWRKTAAHTSHFRDLPPESFASEGTRVNTVVLTLHASLAKREAA